MNPRKIRKFQFRSGLGRFQFCYSCEDIEPGNYSAGGNSSNLHSEIAEAIEDEYPDSE